MHLEKQMPYHGTTSKLFSSCLLEIYSTIIANHIFIQISTSTKTRNNSHYGRKYICSISNWRGPGSTCFLLHLHHFPTESMFFPSPQLCWLNLYISRHLLWFSLLILKPIWIESFSLHPSPLGWGPDILPILTGSSMKAELCYLDPPATQGGSAIYHLKPQFHPSLDFQYSLMPMDSFGCVPTQKIESPWIAIPAGIKPKFIKYLWTLYIGLQENSLMKSPNSWGSFSFHSYCFFTTFSLLVLLRSQGALPLSVFPFLTL